MSIKEIRENKVLDTELNYQRWGVLSRRAFMNTCKLRGIPVEAVTLRNYAAEEKEAQWLKNNVWAHPFGNTSHPQTIAYNSRKEALKEGIFKTEYRAIYADGSFTAITKIEFDYYNTL